MSEEEIEKIKDQLKNELRQEIQEELDNKKRYCCWRKYTKSYIEPTIVKKVGDTRIKWSLQNAINTFARVITKCNHVSEITEEKLESLKPKIETILNLIENQK